MKPVCYAAPGENTSPRFAAAFAAGSGGSVLTGDEVLAPGPIAMFGSPQIWRILRQARAEGRDWYYGDHAYFLRGHFFRITHNGYQQGFPGSYRARPDFARLKQMGVTLAPFRRGGAHILLCPPDAGFAARAGFDAGAWTVNVAAELRRHTDRPIRIRHREGAETNPVTLGMDLEGAHALVTHHSNAAVEALCLGYPVFTTGQCAAREMAETELSRIESPRFPSRRAWAARLANAQWTMAEIASGAAWAALQEQERI